MADRVTQSKVLSVAHISTSQYFFIVLFHPNLKVSFAPHQLLDLQPIQQDGPKVL